MHRTRRIFLGTPEAMDSATSWLQLAMSHEPGTDGGLHERCHSCAGWGLLPHLHAYIRVQHKIIDWLFTVAGPKVFWKLVSGGLPSARGVHGKNLAVSNVPATRGRGVQASGSPLVPSASLCIADASEPQEEGGGYTSELNVKTRLSGRGGGKGRRPTDTKLAAAVVTLRGGPMIGRERTASSPRRPRPRRAGRGAAERRRLARPRAERRRSEVRSMRRAAGRKGGPRARRAEGENEIGTRREKRHRMPRGRGAGGRVGARRRKEDQGWGGG